MTLHDNKKEAFSPLSKDEEYNLIKLYQEKHSEEALLKLLLANEGLVYKIACKYNSPGIDLHDLSQEGTIGLMKAISMFDVTRGSRLSTYASYRILYSILEAKRAYTSDLKIPRDIQRRNAQIKQFSMDHYMTNGRTPTPEAISATLGLDVELVIEALSLPKVSSIDAPIMTQDSTGTSGSILDYYPDTSRKHVRYTSTISSGMKAKVREALNTLTERNRDILLLRYGAEDYEKPSYEEIASKYNLTRQRIHQIERESLLKINQYLSSEKTSGRKTRAK